MLDERKTAILGAVVQEYVATAQPVGSTHIARAPSVQVSPATVRNEMAVLEQEGYLIQPHTSAGRVPTDKGYRFFVDHLTRPGRLDEATSAQVGQFFAAAHGRLEEMLHRTSNLLTDLTTYASVVVGPKADATAVRSVQLVGLSATMATVVVVFGNGAVESQVVNLSQEVTDQQLSAAAAHLSSALAGSAIAGVIEIPPSGDPEIDQICATTFAAIRAVSADDHVYLGGTASVAAAFDAVEVVRDVLHTLEQQFIVVSLVRDIVDRGMSVSIGVEHGVEPLSACSVVVAPVVVDGEHLGSVGVLGPTRMNYPQALATVDVV
ncbi:MAG: heat-inducible transcriptional repressor HrcA, partial [Ilumatobacteraceae bacterium]